MCIEVCLKPWEISPQSIPFLTISFPFWTYVMSCAWLASWLVSFSGYVIKHMWHTYYLAASSLCQTGLALDLQVLYNHPFFIQQVFAVLDIYFFVLHLTCMHVYWVIYGWQVLHLTCKLFINITSFPTSVLLFWTCLALDLHACVLKFDWNIEKYPPNLFFFWLFLFRSLHIILSCTWLACILSHL